MKDRQANGKMNLQTDRQMFRLNNRKTQRQTHMHIIHKDGTDRHTYRQTDGHTTGQSDR